MFYDLMWEVIVRVVDIGWLVDRDCLNSLLIIMFWRHIETNLIKMRQKVIGKKQKHGSWRLKMYHFIVIRETSQTSGFLFIFLLKQDEALLFLTWLFLKEHPLLRVSNGKCVLGNRIWWSSTIQVKKPYRLIFVVLVNPNICQYDHPKVSLFVSIF